MLAQLPQVAQALRRLASDEDVVERLLPLFCALPDGENERTVSIAALLRLLSDGTGRRFLGGLARSEKVIGRAIAVEC
jgi:hypothetical protein